jgi:hypothetical protein
MAWDSAWQRLGQKADAVPSGRGKGAQDREEREAYFLGTRRPGRRAVFPRPFRVSVTSQSAVGEGVKRILSGRSKDFLTVPIVYGIHFPAMRNSLSYGSPARKVLGAQWRRVGGLARARRSGLGTGRSPATADKHVRATAFSGAVPASVAPLSIVIARERREGTRIKPGRGNGARQEPRPTGTAAGSRHGDRHVPAFLLTNALTMPRRSRFSPSSQTKPNHS